MVFVFCGCCVSYHIVMNKRLKDELSLGCSKLEDFGMTKKILTNETLKYTDGVGEAIYFFFSLFSNFMKKNNKFEKVRNNIHIIKINYYYSKKKKLLLQLHNIFIPCIIMDQAFIHVRIQLGNSKSFLKKYTLNLFLKYIFLI